MSPDHVTQNQIDHMCSSYDDREAATEEVPLHHQHTHKIQCWAAEKQRHSVSVQLRHTNRFQILHDTIEEGDTRVEDQWNLTKVAWKDTCEEVLGKRERERAERLDFCKNLTKIGNTEVQTVCAK